MHRVKRQPSWSVALSFLPLSACGAGIAGVAASTGDSGGSNSPPAIRAFQVTNPKTAPAHILFVLADPESNPIQVELFARIDGRDHRLDRVTGITGNPTSLATSHDGILHDVTWNFPDETFLPDDAHFVPGVTVFAQLAGTAQALVAGANSAELGMGNDPPVVVSIDRIDIDPVEGQAAGVTGIELTVGDTSDDLVSVQVDYDIQGDLPDALFQLARPALLDPDDATPEFGIDNVQVKHDGTRLTFFWDTNVDLEDLERDVVLRFTATDGVARGTPRLAPLFRVDNNEEPIVQLDSGQLVLNPDERRGIPVPYRLIDAEGDLVDVIFQWRRPNEEFPDLPEDRVSLAAILEDPRLRREKNICTHYPHFAQGRVISVDSTSVRLPELATGESWILANGIVARRLELLRPSLFPAPITPTWPLNPLDSPIAALPVGDGLTAVVLDAPDGSGRLREIELATGRIVRGIATLGPGFPSTMAYEPDEDAVLVATDISGFWRVARVELAAGTVTELHVAGATSEPGPIRSLAVLGTGATLATIGSSLMLLQHDDALAPRAAVLLADLATPWGLAVDPWNEGGLYLAERNAITPSGIGRILAVDLDHHGKLPVVVRSQPVLDIPQPEALVLARSGARLLAVTRHPSGGRQLLGLNLGGRVGNTPFPLGQQIAHNVAGAASGPDGLVLLTVPSNDELLIGGGLEQRHTIHAFEPLRQLVTLETPLDPTVSPGQPWRIRDEPRRSATATGIDTFFNWNSTDVVSGPVFLKASPLDVEPGTMATSAVPKLIRAAIDVEGLALPAGAGSFGSLATADLDGDGDRDLVAVNDGDNLTVFLQSAPGSFDPAPLTIGGPTITVGPRSVTAADLDGDGDHDLASANSGGDNLTVFLQRSPGGLRPEPSHARQHPHDGRPGFPRCCRSGWRWRPGSRLCESRWQQPDGFLPEPGRGLRSRPHGRPCPRRLPLFS